MASFSDISRGSFRNELMSTLRSMAPYSSRDMVEMISQDNPKYRHFYTKGTRREEILTNHSIALGNPYDKHPMGGEFGVDGDYHSFMYANVEPDKHKRLQEYRMMASSDYVVSALDKICDEFIVLDDDEEVFKVKLDEKMDKQESKTIKDEFYKFVKHFDLDNKGWEYCRDILVDGELYFENIIHEEHREKGILGIVSVPTESVSPIFNNVQNLLVRGYLMQKPIYDENTKKVKEVLPIIFDKNQITYFHSNEWNENKTFRMPHIEHAKRAYKQLNMIEDSIVVYRLVNAPEKLVFKIDVGNMPSAQSERYIQQLSQKYWSRKTYDSKQGGVNMFNPQSMLDAYWFPKRQGNEGTEVSRLPSSGSLGELPDLNYFVEKLYVALKVPKGRIAQDSSFSDGTDMLREELEFAKFVIRLQKQFANTIKQSFITHLKLRGWWDEYDLNERSIKLKMNPPTQFHMLRNQQIFELESSNYGNMAGNELVSETYAQKMYLEWPDEKILANREYLRKEMELKWELQAIAQYGPDWRKQQENAEGDAADAFDAGGGGGMGGDTDFGGDSGLDDMGDEDMGGDEASGGGEDFGTTPDVSDEPEE